MSHKNTNRPQEDKKENLQQNNPNNELKQEADEATSAEAEIAKLQEEITKLKDSFLRAYAESENTKKRCQQELEKNTKYALASFAKELLGVADNLDRALSAVDEKTQEQCGSFIQGVEMTQKELSHVFEKFGIKKIDCLGKIFDPNFERVVQEIDDPSKPAGTIITELQAAYTINDRILREAMVIVTKGGK